MAVSGIYGTSAALCWLPIILCSAPDLCLSESRLSARTRVETGHVAWKYIAWRLALLSIYSHHCMKPPESCLCAALSPSLPVLLIHQHGLFPPCHYTMTDASVHSVYLLLSLSFSVLYCSLHPSSLSFPAVRVARPMRDRKNTLIALGMREMSSEMSWLTSRGKAEWERYVLCVVSYQIKTFEIRSDLN